MHEPGAAAAYWIERNVERWQAALSVERTTGLAVCDTDPLKLHYIRSLWQIGEAKIADWQMESAATREAIARGRIGFADRYLVGTLEPDIARERRRADHTRLRRNFELHVRLHPALIAWYTALDAVMPGRVQFAFPTRLPAPAVAEDAAPGRYDVAAFDRMIAALPGGPGA